MKEGRKNMRGKIGIDIDGVITDEGDDENNIWHNSLCDYFGEELERKNDVFDFTRAYELTEKKIDEFISDNIKDIYKRVNPAFKVKEVLGKLSKLDFEIILITARNNKFRKLTENWLRKHSIPYNELIHEENKAPLAKKIKIDIFIEDNKDNIIQLNKYGIAVIIMDRYHNRQIQADKNIFRAYNWKDIEKYIFKYFSL